jgi:uncharacterized damage-inducible protein DinB
MRIAHARPARRRCQFPANRCNFYRATVLDAITCRSRTMSIAATFLPEFEHEMASTRRILERMPHERAAWKPHPKSFSMGDLGLHLAQLPNWLVITMNDSAFDANPPGGPPFPRPVYESVDRTLAMFDANDAAGRAALASATDEQMLAIWTLKNGGQSVLAMPRVAIVRSFVLNHIIHHRGQMSLYLRLCDVPVPGMYGPTADDKN